MGSCVGSRVGAFVDSDVGAFVGSGVGSKFVLVGVSVGELVGIVGSNIFGASVGL